MASLRKKPANIFPVWSEIAAIFLLIFTVVGGHSLYGYIVGNSALSFLLLDLNSKLKSKYRTKAPKVRLVSILVLGLFAFLILNLHLGSVFESSDEPDVSAIGTQVIPLSNGLPSFSVAVKNWSKTMIAENVSVMVLTSHKPFEASTADDIDNFEDSLSVLLPHVVGSMTLRPGETKYTTPRSSPRSHIGEEEREKIIKGIQPTYIYVRIGFGQDNNRWVSESSGIWRPPNTVLFKWSKPKRRLH